MASVARVLNCLCGFRIEGDGEDAMLESWREHAEQTHGERALGDAQLRSILRAWSRTTPWNGERRTLDGHFEIRAMCPKLADDFLRFFDQDAFMDNAEWLFHVGVDGAA